LGHGIPGTSYLILLCALSFNMVSPELPALPCIQRNYADMLGVHLRYSRIINRQLLIAPLEILLIVLSSTYWYTVTVSVVAPFSFFGMMVTKVQVG